jgi:site-specific DNA-methyltransferase (adenine-specific)/modification methylase
MDDSSVSFVFTSPLYNIRLNFRSKDGGYKPRSDSTRNKYLDNDDCLPMLEYYEMLRGGLREMLRVSKNYVFINIQLLTGNKLALFKLIGEFAESLKEVLIWDKTSAEPSALDGVLNSEYEFILAFAKTGVPVRQFQDIMFKRGTVSNILRIPKELNISSDYHNAVMPSKLARTVINNFTKENDTIYDPFMGSGTTAIACLKLGRNFIGSEISPKYCDLANKRIENELKQLKLAI